MAFSDYLNEQRDRIASKHYRYEFCDETCTIDCGHCKGKGKPMEVKATASVILTNHGVYVPKGK